MRKKGFNKKRIKYRNRLIVSAHAREQAKEPPVSSCAADKEVKRFNQDFYDACNRSEIITFDQTSTSFANEYHDVDAADTNDISNIYLPVSFRVLISCATDKGPKRTNQDYYGIRIGNEIITFDQTRTSFAEEYHGAYSMLAAVADGVSNVYHPDDPEEDAQAIAVKHLLNNMYYQYNMDGQEDIIADELNDLVLDQAERLGGILATTISAIGISDGRVNVMYLGDSPVLHIHHGELTEVTPPKQSNFLDNYLGNTFVSGGEMAVHSEYPLDDGDTWIIGSDGTFEAFTLPDGSINNSQILDIINKNPAGAALDLVRISGEKTIPGKKKKCTDNRTAIVIQIMEEHHDEIS